MAGLPVRFFMLVVIVPLHSLAVIAPLGPFRAAIPVVADAFSTISAASGKRHQHCQEKRSGD
jgi:hypothetical protein